MLGELNTPYRFGKFELNLATRQLLAHGSPVALGARAFDVLIALVERRDRLVAKSELLDVVWPGLVVEENNLQVQISSLRKILGPQAIATVPGRGYRFAAELEGVPKIEAVPSAIASTVHEAAPSDGRRDNLVLRSDQMYGREQDVAAVRTQLGQHRVVSVVGTAGIGKTRVAQAVASASRETYRDGVWMADLAPLSEPKLVVAEMARTLESVAVGLRPEIESIATGLAARTLLLVLDNCEHLLEPVAILVDAIVRTAADVRVLIASQEPLKIASEHVYRLSPLAVPSVYDLPTTERYGAVQLFVNRAQAVDPRFQLSANNVASVVEICHRLDGIPLALELAAARVPLLGVEGLRTRLDERFHVLSGGSRFVLRRHQTLQAAMDFSHGLLSADERAVFRRLGVFTGTFALESAQEVCADEAIDIWKVLDCLGALVDKSLVIAEAGDPPRLRLLETARAYALEKLADAGETAICLGRHGRATAKRMEPAYEESWRLSTDAWVARFEPELDNVRSAIAWSLSNEPELAIRLVGDSLKLWYELAAQPEALQYCAAALEHVSDATSPRDAGRLLYAQAMMLANSWESRSHEAARKAVDLLRRAGDRKVLALALVRASGLSSGTPTPDQWGALAELERLEDPGWPGQLRWLVPYSRGILNRAQWRVSDARQDFERGRDIQAAAGDRVGALRSEILVSEMALAMDEADTAIAILQKAVHALSMTRERLFYMFGLRGLVIALLVSGNLEQAREPFATAVPLILGYDMGFLGADMAGLYAARDGRLASAARLLGYSETVTAKRLQSGRDVISTVAHDLLVRLLAELAPEEREARMQEGRGLSDADAYREAIGRRGEILNSRPPVHR